MALKIEKGSNKRKYIMIFICMLMQAIPFSVAQNIQPLFIPYVIKKFDFSLAAFSLIFTFGSLASAVCSPFLGKLFGKINVKILFLIGSILSSLAFVGFGFSHALPEFYLFSAIAQIGCVLFSGLGTAYLIGTWFPKEGRGEALGLAFAGGSIGNVFLQPLVSSTLASKGSSTAYIIFGIASLVASLVLVLLFIRTPKPGELSDEEINGKAQDKAKEQKEEGFQGVGAALTRKNKFFWLFGIGYAFIGVAIAACSTQYASYFKLQLHLSPSLIGILGSVFAFFCLFGNIGGGALFDKLGSFKAMFIAFILQGLAIIGMLISRFIPEFSFMFSVCYGLCVFSYMSGPAFITADIFGKKESSVNLGTVSLMFAIGFALGSTIFGMFVQTIGFNIAWIAMIVFLVVGYFLLLTSIKKVKKQNQSLQ